MSTRTTARPTWRRALFTLTATSTALAALTLPATAGTTHDCEDSAHTITIEGSNVFPESVAADSHYVYTGSIDDGAIYRGRVGAKTLEPFLPGGQDGRTQATGIKIAGSRLLVAGAFTGRFFIYDTDTGKLVSAYAVADTGEPTLVNDEAVVPNGDVYITDSFRSVVYRIPAAEVNTPAGDASRTLQVAYHLPDYVVGESNGNGIVATPDGNLIIGYWYSGALYRLTLATGEVRKIDVPALTSADGIARQGNTLYIARSTNNEVATVRLSGDEARATVVSERTYPGADTTTGVAVIGDRLLVTNSQMDTYLYGDPLTSPVFTLESLPLH